MLITTNDYNYKQFCTQSQHQHFISKSNYLNYELEYKIKEIFTLVYDYNFHKLLQLDLHSFLDLISSQVKETFELIYSKPIDSDTIMQDIIESNNRSITTLFSTQSKLLSIYLEEYNAMSPSFNFLKRFRKHCPQTSTFAFHLCNSKDNFNHSMLIEISLNNKSTTHVICINCQAVYPAQRIKLHCTNCNVNYYSSILNEGDNLDLLPATWESYHCKRQLIEKMKCIKCFHVLYYNLKTLKLICLNPRCNFTADPMSIIWKCSICNVEFQSKAKIYNPLKGYKYQKAIRMALIHQQKAYPMFPCCCSNEGEEEEGEKKILNYYHNSYCQGQLYLGVVNRKSAVVCELCKILYYYERFIWTCPMCGKYFTSNDKCVVVDSKANKTIQDQYIKEQFNNNIRRSVDNGDENDNDNKTTEKRLYLPKTIQPKNLFEMNLNNEFNGNTNDTYEYKKGTLPKNNEEGDNYRFDILSQIKSVDEEKINESEQPQQQRKDANEEDIEEEENGVIFLDGSDQEDEYIPFNQIIKEQINKSHVDFNPIINTILPPLDLDQYETIKKIGQGAYASIFEVEDINTKQHYALKKVIANDIPELKKYQLEYEMIYSHPHPNIIQLIGFTYKQLDFMTYSVFTLTELSESDWDTQINNYHKANRSYSEEEFLNILKQLSSAFAFLQHNRITHRDIKPENVLVFPNGVYKICDFGESKYVRKDKDLNTLKGTEMFMSPDMYKALYHNEMKTMHNSYKSDVFSFGLCFIFAITLDYSMINGLRKEINCIDKVNELSMSFYFTNILKKMITINEDERYDFIEIENYFKQ